MLKRTEAAVECTEEVVVVCPGDKKRIIMLQHLMLVIMRAVTIHAPLVELHMIIRY